MTVTNRYNRVTQWLHWLVAALIFLQYVLIELAEWAEQAELTVKQLGIVANHKSIGITVLFLAVLRLLYRLKYPAPELPASMPKWQIAASKVTHLALYALLFALPISGWLMSSASAYSVSYFNLFTLPDFIAANSDNADRLEQIHEWLADGLVVLAALHIVAALKHHWIDKDDILRRMANKRSILAATVLIVGGIFAWGGILSTKTTAPKTIQTILDSSDKDSFTAGKLPAWNIDYEKSHIKFTGEQAGAPFTGTWNVWKADLRFDPQQLQDSSFYVTVDIGSVYTNDMERDETIQSAEFFDVVSFPQAIFQSSDFTGDSDAYIANAELIMKGIRQPINFHFKVNRIGNKIKLEGDAQIVRHQWNIGTGDWADPTWVGSDVKVSVLVEATFRSL